MEDSAEGARFLKQKYNLHKAPEVAQAARRVFMRTDEVVPQDPLVRIQNYLSRFTEVAEREDPERRQHGVDALKRVLHTRFIITPTDIPESAFLLEQRIARELGHGDVDITDDFREQKTQQIITDQARSLDKWVDYLSSEDAKYPDWAKYWTVRSVVAMGKLEKHVDDEGKETARFTRRTKDTVAPFPPLNPRALARTITAVQNQLTYEQRVKRDKATGAIKQEGYQKPMVTNMSEKLTPEEFAQLASMEDFSRLYTQFLIELPEYSTEGLQETRGKWVTYPQDSDPTPLAHSLEGYPLEWCTANVDTAKTQLEGGDFHVYYSIDNDGNPVVPRVAIRMEGDRIVELRGIAPDQHIDPYITQVIYKKLEEFGTEGALYQKRARDMRRLTEIEHQTTSGQPLSKDDLIFLYEINSAIDGFGYGKDPRIAELRATRNPKEDAPIVFECSAAQIAWQPSEVTPDTKAYVGPLFPGIFDKLRHADHLHTSFPEGRIERETLEMGGITKEALTQQLRDQDVQISPHAEDMLRNSAFVTLADKEAVDLVHLKVGDFGFKVWTTTRDLFAKALEFGLELVPTETGPQYRLAHMDQPMGDWVYMGMEPITNRPGRPDVFVVERRGDGRWLADEIARPDSEWATYHEFVFRLRKLET